MRYIRCLFCDNGKQRFDFLCRDCRLLYGPYDKELWFIELVAMERKQLKITRQESTNYDVSYLSKEIRPHLGSSRARGRPRTTSLVESYVRSIYESTASVRQVTARCLEAGLIVSRESIRTILNKIKVTKNKHE